MIDYEATLRERDAEIERLRSANGEAFRDAVKLACDDRMTEQKHEIRRLKAEVKQLQELHERSADAMPLIEEPKP